MVRLHDPRPVPKKAKAAAAVLPSRKDRFNGMTVELSDKDAKLAPIKFKKMLSDSLQAWEKDGIRGVWLKVTPALSTPA